MPLCGIRHSNQISIKNHTKYKEDLEKNKVHDPKNSTLIGEAIIGTPRSKSDLENKDSIKKNSLLISAKESEEEIECRKLAKYYAELAFSSDPITTLISINTSNGEIIAVRPSRILEIEQENCSTKQPIHILWYFN